MTSVCTDSEIDSPVSTLLAAWTSWTYRLLLYRYLAAQMMAQAEPATAQSPSLNDLQISDALSFVQDRYLDNRNHLFVNYGSALGYTFVILAAANV